MAAATIRGVTEEPINRGIKKNSDLFRSADGNELVQTEEPHKRQAQKASAAVAAFRWSPRKAAHIRGHKTKILKAARYGNRLSRRSIP